jgi:hypothetical protein
VVKVSFFQLSPFTVPIFVRTCSTVFVLQDDGRWERRVLGTHFCIPEVEVAPTDWGRTRTDPEMWALVQKFLLQRLQAKGTSAPSESHTVDHARDHREESVQLEVPRFQPTITCVNRRAPAWFPV